MSKNSDKTADLLVQGEDYLISLINDNNGTNYTADQIGNDVIIGAPRESSDVKYNTDIEVTFPTDSDPVTGELHYERFDLGRLFANKNLIFRDGGYTSTLDLIAPIMSEARIVFETTDLVDTPIAAGYPKRVIVKADPLSLRFIGQFSVEILEPINDDDSFLTAPETTNNTTPSNMALKPDGSGNLFIGTGTLDGGMTKCTNDEIEVCGTARLSKFQMVFNSTNNQYKLDIGGEGDWNFIYSFALIDSRNADRITDLYDCSVKVTAPGGGVLNFAIQRLYGQVVLVDAANQLTVNNPNAVNVIQTLCQDIQRVSYYKGKLGSLPLNAAGYPYGTYTFEMKAVRKIGNNTPVVVTFDVVVSSTTPN